MEWYVTLSLSLSLLLAAFLTGLPLFVGFLLVNLGTVWAVTGSRGFVLVANSIFDGANIAALSAVPLFILMGEILTRSGSVGNLFRAVDGLVGRVRGRQYVLTVLVSVVFGALSGAAMAVAAMLGRSLYPTMIARGYDPRLSVGAILGGATLAPIIPPSVLAVVIATLADVSIGRLLIAGIVPGLVAAVLFLTYILGRCALAPRLSPEPEAGERAGVAASLLRLAPFSVVIFSVMGLILLGVATPSEAAATGVVGACAVAAIYRRLNWAMLRDAVEGAMLITAMIMVIVVSSNLFGQLLAFTGSTRQLVALGAGFADRPLVLLAILLAIVFALCMFVDQIALLLLLVPIFKPLVAAAGFDPVWFWLLVLVNLSVGGITPPFGYTMFALKGAVGNSLPLATVYRAAWPFVGLYLLLILLLIAFPPLVTWLPGRI